jgi:hypothetical protein
MATLGDMKSRIGDEIARGDLTSQIALCITDAIQIYQKKRFRFSDNTFTFPTVTGQEYYTATDNTNIASLYIFDYVVVQIGNARFDVLRREPEEIELLTQSGTQQGQPQVFSYFEQQIRFFPVPNTAYPIIVAANTLVAAPATDIEAGNPWMLDAERLIRCRAKYELAVHYTRDADMAALMSPDEPGPGQKAGQVYEAFSELKGETNILTGVGRVQPTQF